VLRDVTFQVTAGKLTALVGPSGAGKTTITHLVPRLYDPVRGTVRIGGHDVRDLTLESLRSVVGVVPQDAHLFHDTIRANLLYARPSATERELTEACQAARIWELISSLPDGLDTIAGDRGYRFSGGEKQRLALARLLLKAPSVVVLDEAPAHLDSESEAAIPSLPGTSMSGARCCGPRGAPWPCPEARTGGSAQRTCRFERRRQPAPLPGSTLPLSRASLAGNRPFRGVSATDVSTTRVPLTSRYH